LNQGRTGEAIHLYERVANDNDRAPEERVQAWQELSGIEFDQSEVTDAVIAAENAIDSSTATESSVYLEPLMTYLDRLAGRLTHLEHYDLAKRVMEYALPRFPNSGLLWRRLGCVQWYNDEPIAAFASLSTALNNGEDRSHVIHERGQVLAEMGRFREAIAELTEDLNYERSSESAAFARSTRAYAYGMLGEMDFALKEFSSAEQVTPENAWLQYFRALCYHQQNMDDVCVRGLHAALSDQLPPLNKAKRDWAIKLLKELEPRCD
jgi:tetratricopeptide (TPR) repeat protein